MPSLIGMQRYSEENSSEIVAERLPGTGAGSQSSRAVRPPPACSGPRDAADPGRLARQAIRFLTEVGHASDDRRQEWILLSDLLGVTALVEEINTHGRRAPRPTRRAGHSIVRTAPRYPAGATISLDGVGEPLAVSGDVRTSMASRSPARRSRHGRPMPRATTRTSSPTGSPTSTCGVSSSPTQAAASTTGPSSPAATRSPTTARSASFSAASAIRCVARRISSS